MHSLGCIAVKWAQLRLEGPGMSPNTNPSNAKETEHSESEEALSL